MNEIFVNQFLNALRNLQIGCIDYCMIIIWSNLIYNVTIINYKNIKSDVIVSQEWFDRRASSIWSLWFRFGFNYKLLYPFRNALLPPDSLLFYITFPKDLQILLPSMTKRRPYFFLIENRKIFYLPPSKQFPWIKTNIHVVRLLIARKIWMPSNNTKTMKISSTASRSMPTGAFPWCPCAI